MEFILMLIAFFNLNVTPDELTEAEIADLETQYYEAQAETTSARGVDGIRREIQTLR